MTTTVSAEYKPVLMTDATGEIVAAIQRGRLHSGPPYS